MCRSNFNSYSPFGFYQIFIPTDEQLEIRDRILCCGFRIETSCKIIAVIQSIYDIVVVVACIFGLILRFSTNLTTYFMNEWNLSEDTANEAKTCKGSDIQLKINVNFKN